MGVLFPLRGTMCFIAFAAQEADHVVFGDLVLGFGCGPFYHLLMMGIIHFGMFPGAWSRIVVASPLVVADQCNAPRYLQLKKVV